jgi:hypothetical protein
VGQATYNGAAGAGPDEPGRPDGNGHPETHGEDVVEGEFQEI